MTLQNGLTPNMAGLTLVTTNTANPAPLPGAETETEQGGQTQAAAASVQELPEWAQRELRDLRKENASRRQAAADAETARKLAEEQRLTEEKKWEELAKQRGDEVTALKSKADAYDTLQARLLAQAKAEVAKWPSEVQGMAPAEEDGAAWLAWVERARPVAAALNGAAPAGGNPSNPPAQGKSAAVQEAVRSENARFVSTRF